MTSPSTPTEDGYTAAPPARFALDVKTTWCPACGVHAAIAGRLCPVCEPAPKPAADDLPDTPGDRRAAWGEGPA